MMKKILSTLLLALPLASLQASVLLQDSTNYPYANGPIASQGQWYIYSGSTAADDITVSNNTIYLDTTNKDSVATPTNGFYTGTNGTIVWASFTLNVSKAPSPTADGYFCSFISTNSNYCCNVFVSSKYSVVPGTYRLSIANFSVSFSNLDPPVTYPLDLCTNVPYEIVIAYDIAQGNTEGANLLIDPSLTDYNNLISGEGEDNGFVYGTDIAVNAAVGAVYITSLGFSPYIDAGISNVIIGTTFADVYAKPSAPVFGIQPISGSAYSGNSATFTAVAAGSDVTYQWYSTTYGMLTDGLNYTGSESNTLVVNDLVGTDSYYAVATDAYGRTATSDTALETVDTTLTPVFFAPSVTAVATSTNLFQSATFTDPASGTGPITYQWYHQATNAGATFVAVGPNGPSYAIYLADLTAPGLYYVVASSSAGSGSSANGPTNTLVEIAPLVATLEQIHAFYATTIAANPSVENGTFYINSNNVVISGFVSVWNGYGSSYSEFFIQDTNGYGCEVYLGGDGNTNTPPIGTYVTISGPLETYYGTLEIAPATPAAIVTNATPPIAIVPFLGNPLWTNLSASPYGSNSLRRACSVVTFTNVYLYGSKTGGALGTGGTHSGVGGIFVSNSYTQVYFTVGSPYGTVTGGVTNTYVMELFQPSYNIGTTNQYVPNQFNKQPIPTYCAQLTGTLAPYSSSYNEVIPSRLEDYLVSTPAPFTASISQTTKSSTVSWTPVGGATYSVYSATNLAGPWNNLSSGLTYFPTNGAFSQTISSGTPDEYFIVTSP
jgi:hypothetical protein